MFMLPESDPDATAVPFTVMVAQGSAAVGLTVTRDTVRSGVTVYDVVPEANAGFSDPDEIVRFDKFASVE